jgi:hypothetical protein
MPAARPRKRPGALRIVGACASEGVTVKPAALAEAKVAHCIGRGIS